MLSRAELKQNAKNVLGNNKWGKAIATYLLFVAISGAAGAATGFIPFVGSLLAIIVSIPFSYGLDGHFLKIVRGENNDIIDFCKIGFDNFERGVKIFGSICKKLWYFVAAYVVMILTSSAINIFGFDDLLSGVIGVIAGILMLISSIVVIVGAIEALHYALVWFIANDNPDMLPEDVVNRSKELMTGHRMDYFVLQLSFFGWVILAAITCGIGYACLAPYMKVTEIGFYEDLVNNKAQ